MRIEEVALANLRRYLSAWHVNEPGARLGDDPEALHELRIAGRRIEAILGQFREFLPAVLQPVRQTLKKLLRVLGEARDFDIALSELDIFAATLLESERASVEPLRLHLIADRAHARARMLAALDSRSVRDELNNLSSLLREPATVVAAGLARHVAPGLLAERMRKVRKGADRLGPRSAMEAYHEVRRQLKKTRYTLEAVAVIYGKPADEMLRALRRWQDKLGQQQDADVAGRRLRTLAALPPENFPPATLFLMGRFAEHYAGAAHRARKLHDKAYQRVRGKWKKLKARLGALAADPPCPGT
jgi:CHAD domain-containing protein